MHFFSVDLARIQVDRFLSMIEKVSAEGHIDSLAGVNKIGLLSSNIIPILKEK